VEPLLDIHDVAARLNITVRHVRRLVTERRIPYLKLGNLLRFHPAEIDAWVQGLAVCTVIPAVASSDAPAQPWERARRHPARP